MLRFSYQCLLRLHPARFRERFAEEMLSMFDDLERNSGRGKLVADAFISLLRQWTMRPQNWEQQATASVNNLRDSRTHLFYVGRFQAPQKRIILRSGSNIDFV